MSREGRNPHEPQNRIEEANELWAGFCMYQQEWEGHYDGRGEENDSMASLAVGLLLLLEERGALAITGDRLNFMQEVVDVVNEDRLTDPATVQGDDRAIAEAVWRARELFEEAGNQVGTYQTGRYSQNFQDPSSERVLFGERLKEFLQAYARG